MLGWVVARAQPGWAPSGGDLGTEEEEEGHAAGVLRLWEVV
jgi:hypothetical protein